jgi:chromate transporter
VTSDSAAPPPTPLREIAAVFLKLGTTAFGGPAAHVAMMHEEVVERRRWLTPEQFLDYLGAVNLIPGPNSTELAIHIGHARAGWSGLLIAGIAFIVPAFLIVFGLAWAYVRYGSLPDAAGILYGVKPVVVAVVAHALVGLARTAVRSPRLAALAIGAAIAAFAGMHELAVLLAAGVLSGVSGGAARARALLVSLVAGSGATAAAASAATPVTLGPVFLVFAKAGAVLFGSGYVLLAFLRADLVERLHWITETQLLDAIAVGQVTPGPVFTTATFIGYLLAGPAGAVVATIGIFLPAFFFVAISGPLVPRLRASHAAGAVLDGVTVASLALMAVVTMQLAGAALVDTPTWAIAVGSLVALVRLRVNSAWLMLAAAALGWAIARGLFA